MNQTLSSTKSSLGKIGKPGCWLLLLCSALWIIGEWPAVEAVAADSQATAAPKAITQLSEHVFIYHGPINVGIVRDGNRALLIDCGDGRVTAALPKLGITKVEKLCFTHHHRDQACGAQQFAASGTKIVVPAEEREFFANPAKYWKDDNLFRVYRDFRQQRLMLVAPVNVDTTLSDGDTIDFGQATIRAIATPGHTDGSLSYHVEVDGRRLVFCGDCLYDEGKLWDLFSLQHGFAKGERRIGGYHGFMGDRWRLIESLRQIKQLQPEVLVPSHGRLMDHPAQAIDRLAQQLERCYENYVAISALRHYFPELFTEYAGRSGQMPIRQGIEPPACLRHFSTTWMLISKTGAALVMDVGNPGVVENLKKMLARNEIQRIEGLWVTHYHFDHTEGIPEFQRQFDCPCFAEKRLAEILINPRPWRLPCLAAEPIRVQHPLEDGHTWQWHEFKLTAFFFPGQTLYHDALFVEGNGLRMLFVGDSFTMAGIDDYCTFNRNWLGRSVGFQYCLSLVEKLRPTHIFNCHVDDAFTFTSEEVQFMRENLDRREELFGELMPWDHANFGLDASWVRCHPYQQKVHPGAKARVEVVVTNHSPKPQRVRCRPVVPQTFGRCDLAWQEVEVPPKEEGRCALQCEIPTETTPGRYVVPVDVLLGTRELPQFAEMIVDVAE